MPVASERDVLFAIQPLTYCFPQMPSNFWGFLSKQAIQKGISTRRLEYIVEMLISTHTYATFTIADFFKIDKSVHILTPSEIENPIAPMAQIEFAGKYYVVYESEAKSCGYKYTKYESLAEREERERKEIDERWEKEYAKMVEDGEVDPNAPLKGLAELSLEISNYYSVKKDEEK